MGHATDFHGTLHKLMDVYAHSSYKIAKTFPKYETYGLGSQLRRASVSVMLNYVEGFARRKKNIYVHFLEISYGSLKESLYLHQFAHEEGLVKPSDYKQVTAVGDRIGRMLWSLITKIEAEKGG